MCKPIGHSPSSRWLAAIAGGLAVYFGVVGESVAQGPAGLPGSNAPSATAPAPTSALASQPSVPAPLREFRGLWVASVANIDWPSKKNLTVEQLRAEMNVILDAAKRTNLNAVVFQVRPACDALYRSDLEPWSEFLTGESGKPVIGAPADYDPLGEWIAGAHARGLQLHAWVNPFRARHFRSDKPDAPSHVSNARADLVRAYDTYLWLDPGEPDAREHSLAVLLDIVNRYDVDGIHYDDYFYPYPVAKKPFPDEVSFGKYQQAPASDAVPSGSSTSARGSSAATAQVGGGLSLDAWRRQNIDTFVRELYVRVKKAKPHVIVSVSPFGIWRPGSPPQVKGFDAFTQLNADARRWLREGWCDAMCPQLYWKAESPGQPYARLLDWWIDQNDQHRHLWPGLNASRVLPASAPVDAKGKPADSWEPSDVVRQISLTRQSQGASGVVAFSAVAITQNRRGLADELRSGVFQDGALVPSSPWLTATMNDAPLAAPAISVTRNAADELIVSAGGAPTSDATLVVTVREVGAGKDVRWRVGGVARGQSVTIEPRAGRKVTQIAAAWMDRVGKLGAWVTVAP